MIFLNIKLYNIIEIGKLVKTRKRDIMRIKHFINTVSSGDWEEICYYDADLYDESEAFGNEVYVEMRSESNLTDEEVEEMIKKGEIKWVDQQH